DSSLQDSFVPTCVLRKVGTRLFLRKKKEVIMSTDSSYDVSYDGYQDWYADENAKFDSVLNDTQLAESNPMMWIMELLGVLMNTYNGYVGWSGEEISTASDAMTPLTNLQGLYSDPDSYTPDQQWQIINQSDEEYQKCNNIVASGDTN